MLERHFFVRLIVRRYLIQIRSVPRRALLLGRAVLIEVVEIAAGEQFVVSPLAVLFLAGSLNILLFLPRRAGGLRFRRPLAFFQKSTSSGEPCRSGTRASRRWRPRREKRTPRSPSSASAWGSSNVARLAAGDALEDLIGAATDVCKKTMCINTTPNAIAATASRESF